jgi:uncharacterized protein YjbI with pentapeptide repeats
MSSRLNKAQPSPGECRYDGRFGNFCHRPGIPDQGGLCYWHSRLPKTRERFVEEYESGGPFEGVVISNLDLSNLDLHGAWFRGFTASHCSFNHSRIGSASMSMAVFVGCNFIEADLRHIRAVYAAFTKCIFARANLEGANLLGADLTDSCFDGANLQKALVGRNRGMIVFPGVGNPHQHGTRIEGASFLGADFRGIQLDQDYHKAPNMQEPLNRLWLREVRQQLDAARNAETNKEKKDTSQSLTKTLIERIPGLQVSHLGQTRATDEIDLIVRNESPALLSAGLGGPIFVECKNEPKKPVSSGDVGKLASKVPKNGVGMIVTIHRLSSKAEKEIVRQRDGGIRFTFWDGSDLERIASGEDTPVDRFIDRYHYILSR